MFQELLLYLHPNSISSEEIWTIAKHGCSQKMNILLFSNVKASSLTFIFNPNLSHLTLLIWCAA